MAKRISKVVTRTGDDGTTGLADGQRVAKSSVRIECIGAIDELNSLLGLLHADVSEAGIAPALLEIQNTLFNVGAELSLPQSAVIDSRAVARLEDLIAQYNADLPPLQEFILPGGNRAAAVCHLARAVCRRCERRLFQLAESEPINKHTTTYINRLSDLLFILARILARNDGGAEIYWRKDV